MISRSSQRCVDIVLRASGRKDAIWRPWSATTTLYQHRCYASANALLQKPNQKGGTSKPSNAPARRTERTSKTAPKKKDADIDSLTPEEKLKNLEYSRLMSSTGELDIWSGPIALMDLHVPAWKSSRKDATLLDHLRLVRQNIRNGFLNIRSMYRMAKVNSFQGVKIKSPWSWKLFTCQSPNNAWMFAFRQMALDMYKNINEAVANRDEKTIKAFSTGEQQLAYIKLARQQDSRFLSVWKLHGERTPCRVVSLRATEGHSGLEGPKIGNRLVVQALVRFDTMQSLELYSKKTGALVPGLDTNPKPVVEYLVFQKRMWYDSPWVIRDRLYEGLDSKHTVPGL